MSCYAVVDTNGLVSALLTEHEDAATVQVLRRILGGEIIPVFSADIIKEYREVLTRKKFGFSVSLVTYLIAALEQFGIQVEPSPLGIVLPDKKDLPFFEVVMESRKRSDAYLVTGNRKHFPEEPFIVTPRELLSILSEN